MLPSLAHVVPVKAKFRQPLTHCHWWFNLKLDPDPFTDNLSPAEHLRRRASQQVQQPPRVQRTIQSAFGEINLGSGFRAQWFGTALKL